MVVIKHNQETVEILPPESSDCDNVSVLTLENFFNRASSTTIVYLDLSRCNLNELPPNCGMLNLKQLNLSHNKFELVPACLYDGLENLEMLDVSYNQLKVFDRQPDCIANLKTVNLSNNRIINIPKWILMFKAVNLLEFNYSNNKAKHYKYLENSFNCSINKLIKLELRDCHMVDVDYSFLRQFKNLRYLDIGNEKDQTSNRFKELDELFVNLKWRQLEVLKVNYLGLALFPTGILWLETLTELHFNGNYISWLPDDIKYMINLEVLEVSQNFLISLPDNLTTIKDLRIVKANDNLIQVVPNFTLMPQLETLDLYNNSLEDISVDVRCLKFVDFENNFLITEHFEFYRDYAKRKNEYREILSNCRYDGFKSASQSHENMSEKEDLSDVSYDSMKFPVVAVMTEDWEQDMKIGRKYKRSSDVDSDDDWNGEDPFCEKGGKIRNTEKVYVLDEDWMFEDVQ